MNETKNAGHGTGRQGGGRGSWVYFIESTGNGRIKIGFTTGDVETRRRALQTGSPEPLRVLAMIQGDEKLERRLHVRFAADRIVGEWFTPSDALVSFVDGIHMAQEQHITGYESRAQAEDKRRRIALDYQARMDAERAAKQAAYEAEWEAEHGEPYDSKKAFQMIADRFAASAARGSGDPFATRLPARRSGH
jgi:hypothetical protein